MCKRTEQGRGIHCPCVLLRSADPPLLCMALKKFSTAFFLSSYGFSQTQAVDSDFSFFFLTEGVKNLPINIQDERKKKRYGKTCYPSPYAQKCNPYCGICGHIQSHLRMLGEPESISTVRDEVFTNIFLE